MRIAWVLEFKNSEGRKSYERAQNFGETNDLDKALLYITRKDARENKFEGDRIVKVSVTIKEKK